MKNLTATSKGFIMTILSFIAAMISTGGFPSTKNGWIVFGISVLGASLVYIGKNWMLPSMSKMGNLDLRDILSGLILAVGSGVSSWVGSLVAGTPIDWKDLLVFVGSVVAGYFAKNLATTNPPRL